MKVGDILDLVMLRHHRDLDMDTITLKVFLIDFCHNY